MIGAGRLEALRAGMKAGGVDAVVLIPGPNLVYVSGADFHLFERPLLLVVPVEDVPVLVIPSLELPGWRADGRVEARVFPWDDAEGPLAAVDQAAAALPPARRIAVERLRMRVQEYRLATRLYPDAEVVDAETLLEPLRARKDAAEVEALREAARLCESALEQVAATVAPGQTEREIAARLSCALLEHGTEGLPIEPSVLGGPNAGLPHGAPGTRRLLPGDVLLIDFVGIRRGYYADITRTFAVGAEPDARLREIHQVVLEANEAARSAIRPGISCREVDEAARRVIRDAGYGDHFLHRTGHGLGLEVHEAPSLSGADDTILAPGMVVTVEPGIYIEGLGGVRIEDNVLVTAGGAESLTTMDRSLRILGT